MTTFAPINIIGKTFQVSIPGKEGTQQAQVVRVIKRHSEELAQDDTRTQYLLSMNDDQYQDVMSYSEILSHIESKEDRVWKFKAMVGHDRPLHPSFVLRLPMELIHRMGHWGDHHRTPLYHRSGRSHLLHHLCWRKRAT